MRLIRRRSKVRCWISGTDPIEHSVRLSGDGYQLNFFKLAGLWIVVIEGFD